MKKIDYKLKQKYICTSLYSESVRFGLCRRQDFGGDFTCHHSPMTCELCWGVYIETTRRESLETKEGIYKGFLGHVKSTNCLQRC